MEIPNNIVNEILNYLARQPYKEVAHLITGVMQTQQKTTQEELPLDDTD